ncbi:MAG: sigma-54 dependent transcriptional regulator [Desulfobacterales bacterium]|jgi:DNA-binding NtrC family response regulator
MGQLSILVVDDEPDLRSTLSHALNRSGYSVEGAANGVDALEKFKTANFNLVISDVKMPQMSGMELLSSIKKMSPQTPVIMISAFGTVSNAVAAMQQGASDYILKPFSFEILEKTVTNVIGRSNGNGRSTSSAQANKSHSRAKNIVTQNQQLQKVLEMARGVAASRATILIQGESGTGKELLAAYVHQNSLHPDAPYIALNCAALPETLAESELFGHEKGSFTGAVGRKIGKFEMAKEGTVVLDEISEMPIPLQAKLLRVLQEKEIDRIGGTGSIEMGARVIAISNVDLKKAVAGGKFREDLFYRINVIPLTVPPLRKRKDDIPILAQHFLEYYSAVNNKKIVGISNEAMKLLVSYEWKGNVRELENIIERAVLVGSSGTILPENLILDPSACESDSQNSFAVKVGYTVKEMEKQLICRTLEEVKDNRTHAAELLGISIRTLRNKLREYKEEIHALET